MGRYTFNQINIWNFVDNQTKIKTEHGIAMIDHDGKWFLRKYVEGKKTYWMPSIYEDGNVISFCYWLNQQYIEIA